MEHLGYETFIEGHLFFGEKKTVLARLAGCCSEDLAADSIMAGKLSRGIYERVALLEQKKPHVLGSKLQLFPHNRG